MGAIGSLVKAGIEDITGTSSGTTLQDFLTKFSPKDGKFITTIDPLNTFDVSIQFHPPGGTGGGSTQSKIKQQAIQMLNNLANNLTGGLAGAIADKLNGNSTTIDSARAKHSVGKNSIVSYLAEGNLLTNDDNIIGMSSSQQSKGSNETPTEIQLGYYIQNITVPMLKMLDGGKSEGLLGAFPLNGGYLGPDDNKLMMTILNTKAPLFERIFYPWMREVTMPFWSYDTCPYTTATITIDFTKHADVKYVFTGCRPQQIGTIQPTQEPDVQITRDITFIFDFMFIQSENKIKESLGSMLLDTAKQLGGSVAKTIGL